MCIVLSTTEHPDYPLIVLSNRDEYFVRPTKLATVRLLNGSTKILSPLDLARPEHGTWIGVSEGGKIAILVNYREKDISQIQSTISRGILPLDYLGYEGKDSEWHTSFGSKADLSKIGGFTFVYGQLSIDPNTKKIGHLNILSNRGDHGTIFETNNSKPQLHGDISLQTTMGVSNSLYYEPWNKVQLGEILVKDMVQKSLDKSLTQDEIIEEGFKILSHDTFDKSIAKEFAWNRKLAELNNSIFIPPLESNLPEDQMSLTAGKYYGTRTQTIILLDKNGNLNYYERDLHNSDSNELNAKLTTSHYKWNIVDQTDIQVAIS